MTQTDSAGLQAMPAGPPGKSAYQVAVDNGYVGTVTQWLASLAGVSITGPQGAPGPAGPVVVSVPTKISGSSATITPGPTYVGVTSISAGGITVTLPMASTFVAGQTIHIVDESGTCSATLPITVVANANTNETDTIAGNMSEVLESKYQRITLMSNGVNLWTIA